MGKTVLALLPAGIAFTVAILVKDAQENQQFWFWLIIGLLLTGGILSAMFINGAMSAKNPDRGTVLKGFIFIAVVVAYVVTFFFTGCLVAFSGLFN